MNHATGLMSTAVTSQPSRIASSGIAPPPAKGSSTLGARPPYASRILSRNHCRSAPDSRPQCRIPPSVSTVTCSSMPPLGNFSCLSVVSMLYILFRCGENCSFVDHEALLLVYDQFLEWVLYAT